MMKCVGVSGALIACVVALLTGPDIISPRIEAPWNHLSEELVAWRSSGKFIDVHGHQVFTKVTECTGVPSVCRGNLLIIHGFPTSSYDFEGVLPALSQQFRVVVFDLVGFGLSDKPAEFGYSIFEHADVTLEVWRQLGVRGGHVVAHDMGDSVAEEIHTRQVRGLNPAWFDEGIESLTLTNGGIYIRLANFRLSQMILRSPFANAFARLGSYFIFARQIESIGGNSPNNTMSTPDIENMWRALVHKGGRQRMPQLITYIDDRFRVDTHRWLYDLGRSTVPLHICWGTHDAVAPLAIPQKVKETLSLTRSDVVYSVIEGGGHFSMLELPQLWAEKVLAFYDGV